MSKPFHTGLVVGKFSPLHRGHELLIRRAVAECDEVLVISYSKPEMPGCDAIKRERWLGELFPEVRCLVATDDKLRALAPDWEVPHNDAEAEVHRRFCGRLCRDILNSTVDAVFTSESYGDGFAAELSGYFGRPVRHVLVDQARLQIPISGTRVRQDVHACREWLSPTVYGSFAERICLLGGESSGKSTLAEALAHELRTTFVGEYGREFWQERDGNLQFDDMVHIGQTQVRREEEAAKACQRYLVCDTSPLTTYFYSQHLFGAADPVLEQLSWRTYDLTLLCSPDMPFIQDGTRQDESFRKLQHGWYLTELDRRGIPFHTVSGPLADRVQQVKAILADTRGERGQCRPAAGQSARSP